MSDAAGPLPRWASQQHCRARKRSGSCRASENVMGFYMKPAFKSATMLARKPSSGRCARDSQTGSCNKTSNGRATRVQEVPGGALTRGYVPLPVDVECG